MVVTSSAEPVLSSVWSTFLTLKFCPIGESFVIRKVSERWLLVKLNTSFESVKVPADWVCAAPWAERTGMQKPLVASTLTQDVPVAQVGCAVEQVSRQACR